MKGKTYVRSLPIEERKRLRRKALMLRKEGVPITKIANILGISKGALEGWIYKNANPDNLFHHPKLHPSKELSYILGVLYGDGCVTYAGKSTYVIKLRTVNPAFASKFKKALEEIGLNARIDIERKSKKNPRFRDMYVVRAFSKIFYLWYKSLTLDTLRGIIRGYEIYFLQGFYESEGSIDLRKRTRQLRIRIVNTNYELLNLCKELIEEHIEISCNLRRRSGTKKEAFEILIEGNSKCRKFLEKVNPAIKREPQMQREND